MHFSQKSFPLGDLSAPFTRTVIADLRGWPRVEKLVFFKKNIGEDEISFATAKQSTKR